MKTIIFIGSFVTLMCCCDLSAQTGTPVSSGRDEIMAPAAVSTDSSQTSGTTLSPGKEETPAATSADPAPSAPGASPGAQPADDRKKPK